MTQPLPEPSARPTLRIYQPPEEHPSIHENRRRFVDLIEAERLKIAEGTQRQR